MPMNRYRPIYEIGKFEPVHIGFCRCGKARGHSGSCYGNPAKVVIQQRETKVDLQQQERIEALGPAERIIQSLTAFTDHVVHNRPGMVVKNPTATIGVSWSPVIWKEEDEKRIVYKSEKIGRRNQRVKVGALNDTNQIKSGQKIIGVYRSPGIFPESAAYYYRQVAEIWKLDNEFAARWASWAFEKDNRDLKVILAAFMLVQSRMGDPVIENGETLFFDENYRDVGEAMCLIRKPKLDLDPKRLMRVGVLLRLPEIIEINRELGFGSTGRNPIRGRYYKVVRKWLKYREDNLPMLEGLVRAGFKETVEDLARMVRYKPSTEKFFEVLQWKQQQAEEGHRTMRIGTKVKKKTWDGMSEKEICELITKEKTSWKLIVGMLPTDVGMTRAIVAAAVMAGAMSKQDLIIMTPTLEELGLLKVKAVEKKWKEALDDAENQRAANIAKNVKTKEAREGFQDAADKATEKALEVATRNLRVYCIVDRSGSMEGALEAAKEYLKRFLGGFPLDRLHVSIFNTSAEEIVIQAPKAAAVEQAFRGKHAGGGTSYAQGVKVLVSKYKPTEEEDALFIFVGDELDQDTGALVRTIQQSGVNPVAFGLLKVASNMYGYGRYQIVQDAAGQLGIPCFTIDTGMFDSDDPYAVTRILQNLISATPVGERPVGQVVMRKTLVQEILETKLLMKPVWASAPNEDSNKVPPETKASKKTTKKKKVELTGYKEKKKKKVLRRKKITVNKTRAQT